MASEMDWHGHDEGLGSVLSGYFRSPEVAGKMGRGHSAGMAWHSVNGDIERKHTTGVFVDKPRHPGERPVLCVYVDTRMRSVDFRANREIYLARLAAAGYEYSDVRFLVNKRPRPKREDDLAAKEAPTGRPSRLMAELTAEERRSIERETAHLPEGLRQSVSKAMSASIRREKSDRPENS